MENKRLEQTTPARQQSLPGAPARDHKAELQRTEELQAVSPVFRKISRSVPQPSPVRWREFSQQLSQQLESSKAPYWQTLKDRLTATDNRIIHWFWILLALAILIIAATIIAVSINEPAAAVALELLQDLPLSIFV